MPSQDNLINWSGDLSHPITPRMVKRLGDTLDKAEHACSATQSNGLCDRLFVAEQHYRGALYDRNFVAKVKAERAKRVPKQADAFKLRDAMCSARARREQFEKLWPDFVTTRELIDARVADDLTEHLYYVAEAKFQDAQREVRADKRAGIRRYPASRIYRH
ncbi:hypothetical protein [Bradyrhizobium genosp. P]|uniref:hypothetical protein n=1 Tax=Bradyrhizobium genosp. P TaxID=83641 RepID=UPI003CF46682